MHVVLVADSAGACDQCLGGDLAAEDKLEVGARLSATEQVFVEFFEVEQFDEVLS